MPVSGAYMVPHPPMIIPQVGRGNEKQILPTIEAYEKAAKEMAALKPDTVIISTPHSVMYSNYFHISPGKTAEGSFRMYGAPEVSFKEEYDTELADTICALAKEKEFPAGYLGEKDARLDHGTMIPLYFLEKEYKDFKIVRIGLSGFPLTMHYELGMMIQKAVEMTGRRAIYIASGDLSHKLQEYGPYGYVPEGPLYDERIMDVCGRGAFEELFDFDENFCDKAAECGHRSFVMMAGALDGLAVKTEKLSHQDVTGVGYGICTYTVNGEDEDRHFLKRYQERRRKELLEKRKQEDPYVKLARHSVETFVREKTYAKIPEGTMEELLERKAGVFVSLHEYGQLRGCIGTIQPVTKCVAQEIINNAVSACSRDPRFDPVRVDELEDLEISVDVLTDPELISGPEELDVKKYGVIVSCGRKQGLLLPDLDGVDTVEQQIAIAMRKGGIRDDERVTLHRFEVIRHH